MSVAENMLSVPVSLGDHDALGRGFVVFANEGGSDLA